MPQQGGVGAHPIPSWTVLSRCEVLPDIKSNLFLLNSPACWVAFSKVTLTGICFLDLGAVSKTRQISCVTETNKIIQWSKCRLVGFQALKAAEIMC